MNIGIDKEVVIEQTDDEGHVVTFKDASPFALKACKTAVFSKNEPGKMLRKVARFLDIEITDATALELLAKEGEVDE